MSSYYPTSKEKRKIVSAYESGISAATIAAAHGCGRSSVYKWIADFRSEKGFDRKRKPGSGRPSKLEPKYEKRLLKYLQKPASKFGFETDLWNTSRIRIVCRKKLKVNLSRMAVWRFLTRFDQSFKKVQKQYYETDVDAQSNWVRTELRQIKRCVKKHRAILYFEDESSIQLSPVMGKSWGPVGEKITHKATGNRGSIAAISAITSEGRLIFNLFDGGKRFNSDDIIAFLKMMLTHHPRRHLAVVMDQAPCHKSKKVKSFVQSQRRLHVFYLPPPLRNITLTNKFGRI